MAIQRAAHRSHLEMAADFLDALKAGPMLKTHIIMRANLSNSSFEKLASLLVSRGYVEREQTTFGLTESGAKLVQRMTEIRGAVSEEEEEEKAAGESPLFVC
jgi:predicted transcriptional regulator